MNPGDELTRSIANGEEALRNRAVRAAGELGRKDLISLLHEKLQADEASCQFWAAWSSVLLGDRGKGLELVKRFAMHNSPFRTRALQVALRVMDTTDARALRSLAWTEPGIARLRVSGLSSLG